MSKAVLNKIHKYTLKAWEDSWEDLLNFELPYKARALIEETKRKEILEPLYQLGEEEINHLEKQAAAWQQALMQELELDLEAWGVWLEEIEQEKYYPELDKPDLSVTPQVLPKPPAQVQGVIYKLHRWDYPESFEGIVKADTAFKLHFANRINKYH